MKERDESEGISTLQTRQNNTQWLDLESDKFNLVLGQCLTLNIRTVYLTEEVIDSLSSGVIKTTYVFKRHILSQF